MGLSYFQRNDRDARFVLFEYLNLDQLLKYDAFKDFSRDDFSMILDEAYKVARDVIGPTLKDGDEQGLKYLDGDVITPDSFKDCWKVLAENGWLAMQVGPEYGGQGLPQPVACMVHDFFNGANMCMEIYTGLCAGAGHLIESYGTEEDKALFVEKMYSGVWGGSMGLTEPDAGSDVGWLRSKATPDPSSGNPRIYKIEGTKRFISGGNHDLTENIIHLMLARIEGAPAGTRGVSLFIVPKIWVNPDGSLGEPNDVFCGGFEHKMGLHGSATCTLNFGENGRCRGILLGEPNSGMAKMFQLMNEARMGTGNLALGVAASAYDTARLYARDRIQGPPFTDRKADRVPIIRHEDVRRMLMTLKSGTEAMRGMLAKLYFLADVAMHEPDPAKKKAAENQLDLFTPLAKAYCSDFAYELTREAIQVMGGAGYCREYPAEQYARDIKSASIYEGTTYIQSLDLVGRKLMMEGGRVFGGWLDEIKTFAAAHAGDKDFGPDFGLLTQAADVVAEYAQRYMGYFADGRLALIPLSSTRFQECMAETLLAQISLEMGLLAREKKAGVEEGSADALYYQGKIASAQYYCRNILVNVFARQKSLALEDTSALDIPEEAFI
jgi:alkylation response protein AidB-like acyl-CoA dehydrogenase